MNQRSALLLATALTVCVLVLGVGVVAVFADNQKLTLGVHYTVGGVSNPAGYTITITTPGDWAPAVWVLDVLYPINQPSDVDQGGQFGARFEAALDRMARSDQVIWERALRSVAVNRTTPLNQEIELPPPVPGGQLAVAVMVVSPESVRDTVLSKINSNGLAVYDAGASQVQSTRSCGVTWGQTL